MLAPAVRRDPAGLLIIAATLLFVCQIFVGTALEFAAAVYAALVIVILTLRTIGFGSVGGVLLANMAISFLGISQILKTLYLQPGDSNLLAPDTTAFVLLIGVSGVCSAAIMAWRFLQRRPLIAVDASPATLSILRNLCLLIGITASLVNIYRGATAEGEVAVGGLVAVARQFGVLGYFAVTAETWRSLQLSKGRQSTSAYLFVLIGYFIFMGFMANSKTGLAFPLLFYLLASASYRRYVTKTQVISIVAVLVGGIAIAYPLVQILRAERGPNAQLTLDQVTSYAQRVLHNPEFFAEDWQYAQLEWQEDDSPYVLSLQYLGYHDPLLGRFLLIANTDGIVSAVNEDGIFGWGAITHAIGAAIPTILYPDKPRLDSGDLLTWHYGIRSYGVVGYPAIGLFADSYAALGWMGAALIPFVCTLALLLMLQLTGVRLGGNIIGGFLVAAHFNALGGNAIAPCIADVTRGIPQYLVALILMFWLARVIAGRASIGSAERLATD